MAILASFIQGVEQFFLTELISLVIAFATLRAYFAKFLAFMEAAGFSPLFIISLLSILTIYGCIATIRCRASGKRRVNVDEECGKTSLPTQDLYGDGMVGA